MNHHLNPLLNFFEFQVFFLHLLDYGYNWYVDNYCVKDLIYSDKRIIVYHLSRVKNQYSKTIREIRIRSGIDINFMLFTESESQLNNILKGKNLYCFGSFIIYTGDRMDYLFRHISVIFFYIYIIIITIQKWIKI